MVTTNLEKQTVERFLSEGTVAELGVEELAQACDRRIRAETQVSSAKAVELARRFRKKAEPLGGILYLTALRSSGWAHWYAGKYKESENAYLKARSLAGRDTMTRARIDRVLIDIYMYLGNTPEAKRRARSALTTFSRLKATEEAAKTRVNYANLLHRQDRHREARRMYSQAADHFLKTKNMPAVALTWYNLGNTCVQLFDFDEANKLYSEARKIFKQHDCELNAIDCLYGLAWLHMLEGDFHIALRELTECENYYAEGNQSREVILCQLDRAEAYLGLNLFVDARDAAERAGRAARKLGITYESAKADLFRGKALAALGRVAAARKALKRAEEGFVKEDNHGFQAATQLALAQIGARGQKKLSEIRQARKRFARAQLPLWEAICDLQIVIDWPKEAVALKKLGNNKAVKTVPHMAAQHHTILGDQQAQKNNMKGAINHWARAADILDVLRGKLPPLELRSSFFSGRSGPHRRLVQAEYERDPLQAAVWSERHKTAGLWSTSDDFFMANPTRARIQNSLSELARYFATLSKTMSNSQGRRAAAIRTPQALRRIQRDIRHDLIELEQSSNGSSSSEGISTLIEEISHTQPVIQFHVGDNDLFAFVHEDGATRTVRFENGNRILDDMIARWRFLVECAPPPLKTISSPHLRDERQILGRIANWLLPRLELPERHDGLLLIPEGQVTSLPWMGLPVNGCVLGEKYRLTFVPSLRHHAHAQRQKTKSKNVRIFVGAATGLPHLKHEVDAVSERLNVSEDCVFRPCRRTDWPDHSYSRIWHYAGHAHLRGDNPFYSSLLLDDGPLFAADFRLKRNKVGLVTLAACRTGQQTSLPGEEASGLVRSLLEMGAGNVVASSWAVSDRSTFLWMDHFYEKYLNGSSVSRAVQEASLAVRESFPLTYHWGSFAVHGAG